MREAAPLIDRNLLGLKWRQLVRAFTGAPWSFKLVCVYVFFEYVRPQSIYSFLAGPPWPMISLLAAVAAFFIEGRRPRVPAAIAVPLTLYSLVVVLSSVFAVHPSDSVNDLKLFANWICLILLLSGTATTERRWFVYLVVFLTFSLKMSQHGFLSWVRRGFAFTSWGVTGGPGWFQNSGEFALQMGILAPLSIYFYFLVRKNISTPKKLLLLFIPLSAVGSIIASSSRGGLLALIVVALVATLRSRYRARAIAALAVCLPLLWLVVPAESKARFSGAGSDATSTLRLVYWKRGMEMARNHPVLGVGQGNWTSYYREHYYVPGDSLNRLGDDGQVLIQPAHNSFVEVASQLGYLGLAVFLWLIGSTLFVNMRTRRMMSRLGTRGRLLELSAAAMDDGLIAFCVAGFFMSVAYYPFIWMQVGMTSALHAAARDLLRRVEAGDGIAEYTPAPRPAGFRVRGSFRGRTAGPRPANASPARA